MVKSHNKLRGIESLGEWFTAMTQKFIHYFSTEIHTLFLHRNLPKSYTTSPQKVIHYFSIGRGFDFTNQASWPTFSSNATTPLDLKNALSGKPFVPRAFDMVIFDNGLWVAGLAQLPAGPDIYVQLGPNPEAPQGFWFFQNQHLTHPRLVALR